MELIHQFRNNVSWYKVLSRAAIVFFANHPWTESGNIAALLINDLTRFLEHPHLATLIVKGVCNCDNVLLGGI